MRIAEAVSRTLITIGGIGTIAAVTLIFVFLVWVVVPLFTSGSVDFVSAQDVASDVDIELVEVDEHQLLAATLGSDGRVRVRQLSSGELVATEDPFRGSSPTSISKTIQGDGAAFGFDDGSVKFARFGFATSHPTDVPSEFAALAVNESAIFDGGLLQRSADGRFRKQRFRYAEVETELELGSAVLHVDHSGEREATRLVAWTAERRFVVAYLEEQLDFMTGESTLTSRTFELPLDDARTPSDHAPFTVLISGLGDAAFLVFEDGTSFRYDLRDIEEPVLSEVFDLVDVEGAEVTAAGFLIGKSTILVGDSLGRLNAWFLIRDEETKTPDGQRMALAHRLADAESACTLIAPSPRSRLVAAGFEDGRLGIWQVTTEQRVVEIRDGARADHLLITPKEDGLVALRDGTIAHWEFSPSHPEATLSSLFAPVWYEGFSKREHSWQSSSGTDDFEPKLGIWPLIYGTVKATLYSMLFAVPIALLAAIYTSEFVSRRMRAPIKSCIEMMASLPSVVLGFLAALFVAPLVQDIVPETLAVLVTVPFSLLLGAHLWRLLPQSVQLRLGGWPRLLAIGAMIPLGFLLSFGAGPLPGAGSLLEQRLFAGDVFLWLDGQRGSGTGAWFVLLLPLSSLLVFVISDLKPRSLQGLRGWRNGKAAQIALARFLLLCQGALAIALGASFLLSALGFDPRGSFIGTYEQRNALIVGFVMGFAVIPIIYTLAEDALSSVPEHLRLASLSTGATQWQTALRVVVPTAGSGLFSAIMIGLGRAVGETMIVLMATGNTSIMDLNLFNGLRTLAANIAIELPEAAANSTHYRTLFLAALVLFLLTFCLNTAAELVRQRFRKKAVRL